MTKELDKTPAHLPLTESRQKQFLQILERTGNVTRAAGELGVGMKTVYSLAEKDAYFKEALEIAKARYLGKLEDAAYHRAVEGVEEDVWFQGQKVGTQKKYSDKLLETMLKASDPNRYSTKVQNQTNNTLIVDSGESTVAALSKFLGLEDSKGESEKAVEGEVYENEDECDSSGDEE